MFSARVACECCLIRLQRRRGLAMLAIGVGLLLGIGTGYATAQMNMAGHDMGMPMKEVPAPEKMLPPVKMTGIGNSHLAITANPEAKMWFEQGLNLLHDFWEYESERAFEQAIRVDPQCAMCYWGLYQALIFRSGNESGTRRRRWRALCV